LLLLLLLLAYKPMVQSNSSKLIEGES
jgi:hypothetical protein